MNEITLKEFFEVQFKMINESLSRIQDKIDSISEQNLNSRLELVEKRCSIECITKDDIKKKLESLSMQLCSIHDKTELNEENIIEMKEKLNVFFLASKHPYISLLIFGGFILFAIFELIAHFKLKFF